MSVPVITLDEKIVTDQGEIVYRHRGLVRLLKERKNIENVLAVKNEDLDLWTRAGYRIRQWVPGEPGKVPETCFEWNIPETYKNLDLEQYLRERHVKFTDPRYRIRFDQEWELVQRLAMQGYFRTLIYVLETIREKRIVLGVGRGSACASYLLFLIGAHRIDPVLYEIPLREFYKEDAKISDPK